MWGLPKFTMFRAYNTNLGSAINIFNFGIVKFVVVLGICFFYKGFSVAFYSTIANRATITIKVRIRFLPKFSVFGAYLSIASLLLVISERFTYPIP